MPSDDRHPVDYLAEEFAERIRNGESPQIDEYCGKYPEHAEMIRAVFPSVLLVERASHREDQHRRSGSSNAAAAAFTSMPQTLGDFQLIREIGRGGMGVVYEAIQRSLKRHVALKVISALIAGSAKQLRRFRREAESAASLHHSNIVPVYGIGEDQGLQYYAMQLIDGVTLAEIVRHLRIAPNTVAATGDRTIETAISGDHKQNTRPDSRRFGSAEAVLRLFGSTISADLPILADTGLSTDFSQVSDPRSATVVPSESQLADTMSCAAHDADLTGEADSGELLPPEDVTLNQAYIRNITRVIANVANALDYAHRQGILHRDIKPANLILDRDGTIWVADFGLARQADLQGVTQTGEIVGTLRYMAPEQLRGEADVRTDIYALGVTLYELLALKPAVDAPLLSAAKGGAAITRLRPGRPEIPADLETITLKACMPESDRRYQSAREFEADLVRFLEDRPILARRVTPFERLWRWSRRNPLIASLSGATVLLLLTIAIILGISNRRIQGVLNARNLEYARAEKNLAEKTVALAAVEREQIRAETNLNVAIAAFEEVFNNIAARGRSESLLDELSDAELLPESDALLSSADVTLLETLLGFFDRLAAENTKDLSTESAAARRRVGDIQQQLGRLDDAQQSYQTALDAYKAVALRKPEDKSLILAQAEILHQMMMTFAKRGEFPLAMLKFQDLRSLLKASPAVQDSASGRFALATSINSLVSFGLRTAVEPRFRPRNPLLNRALPREELPNSSQMQRLRRESGFNAEAMNILQELANENPASVPYRLAMAQATKHKARIAQLFRDWNQADEALADAIRILEDLQKEFPASDRFKYELAETLSALSSFRPTDMQRLMRSQQLSRELLDAHPGVAEYRELCAVTLTRIAGVQMAVGKPERAEALLKEALQHHQQLADQFPDVLKYQYVLAATQQQLAQIYAEGKRLSLARETLDTAIARMEEMPQRFHFRNAASGLLNRLRESRSKLSD